MTPLIITAAITGGGPPRARTPHQPVTPDALVAEALACSRAGAAMIHLHARTEDGRTTTDPAVCRALCSAIREAGCEAILNLSAGDDGGRASHAERLAVVAAGAEIVSLDAGSFNLGERLYDNSPSYLSDLARAMQGVGVRPEIEIFDAGHLDRIDALESAGLIAGPHFVQFVTGPRGTLPADTRLLALLVERLPPDAQWSVSAQTADDPEAHARLMLWAFAHGGHVRAGLEDMIWLRSGELSLGNAPLIERWASTARAWGRPLASPAEARRLLGLSGGFEAGATFASREGDDVQGT